MEKAEWSCLKDVKIIDLSQLLPGPHATTLLMQLGAEVVKVEQPGTGTPRASSARRCSRSSTAASARSRST